MAVSRRKFIQANSVAVLAAQLLPSGKAAEATAPADAGKLAKEGGPKAVQAKAGKRVRWDDREKQQLSATVDQPTLSYWSGQKPNKQTGLFVERFKQYCPREHVITCSSGT